MTKEFDHWGVITTHMDMMPRPTLPFVAPCTREGWTAHNFPADEIFDTKEEADRCAAVIALSGKLNDRC